MACAFEKPTSHRVAEPPRIQALATRKRTVPASFASCPASFQSISPVAQSALNASATRDAHAPRGIHGAIAVVVAFALATVLVFQAAPAHAIAEDDNRIDPTQRADNSFIYDTTIESLDEEPSIHDDHEVQVFGEVIGDCIAADEEGFSWITLTVTDAEDKTSISVLISDEQAGQIDHYGKYGVTGTVLQVLGVFHQACSEHDGLADIHCIDSSVLERGFEHPDAFNPGDFAPGALTILIGLALLFAFSAARERMR